VGVGGHVYDQLQHFISNSDSAVRLARRIHGLTETAKLAAKNIDNTETQPLKELAALLIDTVGFLSGNKSSCNTRSWCNTHLRLFRGAVLKEKKTYQKLLRAGHIASEFDRVDKYVSCVVCEAISCGSR
jgi:hypothetical protein